MSNHTRRTKTPADRMLDLVAFIVIIAVLALGVYAVYGRISSNLETQAIESGAAAQTVKYAADQAGMTVDEFLEQYGLTDAGLNGDSAMSDAVEKMNVENFAKYNGQELDAFLEQYGLKDKVSGDTLWTDAEMLVPTGIMMGGEEQFGQMKEMFELDDSITFDTPWGEAKDKIEAASAAYQEKMANATPAPEAEEEAEGEEATEETEAAAEESTKADAE